MWRTAQITLRPETPDDASFVEDLVFAVRESEPGFRDLSLEERTSLLKDQARMQTRHYRKTYPTAHFLIIEADGNPVGRYYVHQAVDHLHLIELSLLPKFQKHGIGKQLLESVKAEATRTKVPITLSVEIGNPAISFYQNLGFVRTKKGTTHHGMTWKPVSKL